MNGKLYFFINMSRRQVLRRQIIQHDIHFDGIIVERLVQFATLDQITQVA